MQTEIRRIILLGIGLIIFSVWMQVKTSDVCLVGIFIFAGALIIQLVVSCVLGVVRRRKITPWWPAPPLLALAIVLAYPGYERLGVGVSDWEFKQHLPEYVKIVEAVKKGSLSCDAHFSGNDAMALPPLVTDVKPICHNDGPPEVLFLIGAAFPLVHDGYAYCANSKRLEDRFALRPVMGEWYHFSDHATDLNIFRAKEPPH